MRLPTGDNSCTWVQVINKRLTRQDLLRFQLPRNKVSIHDSMHNTTTLWHELYLSKTSYKSYITMNSVQTYRRVSSYTSIVVIPVVGRVHYVLLTNMTTVSFKLMCYYNTSLALKELHTASSKYKRYTSVWRSYNDPTILCTQTESYILPLRGRDGEQTPNLMFLPK